MSLVHWQSLQPLDSLYQHMQGLMSDLLKTSRMSTIWVTDSGVTGITAIEVQTTDQEIILRVKLPHVAVGNLKIQINKETILIQGEQTDMNKLQDSSNFTSYCCQFQSLIPLPSPVCSKALMAELEEGILTLALKKTRKTPQQTIKCNLETNECILLSP